MKSTQFSDSSTTPQSQLLPDFSVLYINILGI